MSFLDATFLQDITNFPKWKAGAFRAFYRHWMDFRQSLWLRLLGMTIEPLLYLFAIGKGLGSMIGDIDGFPYLLFFIPALIGITGMMVSFSEATFGSLTRLQQSGAIDSILLSPITLQEIALAEILWGAVKGFINSFIIFLVAMAFGLVHSWLALFSLGIFFLVSWVFSAFGFLLSTMIKEWDSFSILQTGLVLPMALFSGTFFPLLHFPYWLQSLSLLLPLTHAVNASRWLFYGKLQPDILLNVGVLIFLAIFLTNWSVSRFKRIHFI